MLSSLGIRQKLALLLLIPLTALVLVLVPFTAERIGDARAASRTASLASAAREIGGLIQTLQQERLLALGYLSVPSLDRGVLVAQSQSAVDDTARLRSQPGTAEVLARAKTALDALDPVRQAVIGHSISARDAYSAFRDANTSLLNALRLNNPPGADAQGLTELAGLDALMRSNEEASSVGAVLVAAAADPAFSRSLLADAVIADRQHLQRFRDLVPNDLSSLVDTVDKGQAGQRIREFVATVSQPVVTPPTTSTSDTSSTSDSSARVVSDALTAALSYTGLRRLAQDRVAREIVDDAQDRATAASGGAYGVSAGAVAVFVLVVGLGVTVSRSISRPLRRLTQAAGVVAELSRSELIRVADSDVTESALPQLAAVEVDTEDEIGELAAALNRVQATAALLLERQVTARRNVGTMFANIARRTQTLVGRQLSLIEELEQDQARSANAAAVGGGGGLLPRLHRLDHLATRLRRSADSLLVVSGTIDQVMTGSPVPLAEVLADATAEIENGDGVEVEALPEIAIASSLSADLRLLLAELLENATHFSPPGNLVTVSALRIDGDCHVTIVDHGIGLGQARLHEENQRLLERERLDVAPTSMLGLFVVGRLARRHGLSVRLDHSEDGRGITATVRLPARLLAPVSMVLPRLAARARQRQIIDVEPIEVLGDPFDWFGLEEAAEPGAEPPAPAPAPVPVPAPAPALTPAGLARRVPGTHMVEDMRDRSTPSGRPARDPEAERDALNDFLSGFNRGEPAAGEREERASASFTDEPRPTLAERHS